METSPKFYEDIAADASGASLKQQEVLLREKEPNYQIVGPFAETEWPVGAEVAQCIQGESYLKEGYVHEDGLDAAGKLLPDLDRTRGDNVRYYIAYDGLEQSRDEITRYGGMASGRSVFIPEGGTLDSLPSFRYAKGSLFKESLVLLDATHLDPSTSVTEVAALSKTNDAHPVAILEVVRQLFQDSLRGQSDELWFTTLTPKMYRFLVMNFGDEVVRRVGDYIEIDENDPRTSDTLRLAPATIHPGSLVRTMLDGLQSEQTSASRFKARLGNVKYLIDGLGSDVIPDSTRCEIIELETTYAQTYPSQDSRVAA